ncbi:MAG TPA: hypothetical protein ENJ32_11350 [Crenotrichaceae bacterium]|nr:hypothetical protein [Crenotrichaceae bacterium]
MTFAPTQHLKRLTDLIDSHVNQPAHPALEPVTQCILERYGDATQAILYYGSCLRSENPYDGLIDLYVLVDDYLSAYKNKWLPAFFNRLLPPNVFYLEIPVGEQTIRAKYALISINDFDKATSPAWFHSYIWGRFSQPSRLLFMRGDKTRSQIVDALVRAHITFINRVVPAIETTFDSKMLWSEGLGLSYRTELRPEKQGRALELYENDRGYYDALTEPLLETITTDIDSVNNSHPQQYCSRLSTQQRRIAFTGWAVRNIQGKLLSVARLIKALFTFQGGVDYIVWKIERHSGVQIEVTDKLRRFPLIYGWGVLWRLHRQGILRS